MSSQFLKETSVEMGLKGKVTPEVRKEAESRIGVLEALHTDIEAQIDNLLSGAEQGLNFF